MPRGAEPKIKTTVTMTPRQVNRINYEVRRTGLTFNEVVRRWLDRIIDLDLVDLDIISVDALLDAVARRNGQVKSP